jgi:iron complex transport system ATP-binding protein
MNQVSWWRDDKYILRDISWTVEEGEHWAVIGLNGSGKTSLLNMIAGYIFPSKGELTVLGNRFGSCDLRDLRKAIGWVSSALQENLLVEEVVRDVVLSGKFGSIGLYDPVGKKDLERASELMEEFGCAPYSGRPYSTLSQGERQRVILARALMSSPRLLMLDEPCTGLDVFAREHFLSLIERIASRSDAPTMLYVSHHVEEILPLFSKTLLLRNGRVHSSGTSRSVLSRPNLSDFFGTPVDVSWKSQRPYLHLPKV